MKKIDYKASIAAGYTDEEIRNHAKENNLQLANAPTTLDMRASMKNGGFSRKEVRQYAKENNLKIENTDSLAGSIIKAIPRSAAAAGLSVARGIASPFSKDIRETGLSANILGREVSDLQKTAQEKADLIGGRIRGKVESGQISKWQAVGESVLGGLGIGLGATSEIANFLPGEALFSTGAKAVKTGFKPARQTIKNLAKEGGIYGAVGGLTEGLQDVGVEDSLAKDLLNAGKKTVLGTAMGAGGAGAFGVAGAGSKTGSKLSNIVDNRVKGIKSNTLADESTKNFLRPFAEIDNDKIISIKDGDKYTQKKMSDITTEDVEKVQKNIIDDYNFYSKKAKEFKSSREKSSPIEYVSKNIDKALDTANKVRMNTGKKMGEIESKFTNEKIELSGSRVNSFIEEFFKGAKKYGTKDAYTKKIQAFASDFDKLSKNPTVQEVLDFTRTWQNELDNLKDGFGQFKENKRTYTLMEGAIGDLKNNTRNIISEKSPEYKKLLNTYRVTSKLRDEGNRLLGQEGILGERLKGGAVAKRAINSAQDAGSRQFLKELKRITGYNGISDSAIALQAMKDIGDEQGMTIIGAITGDFGDKLAGKFINKLPFGEALSTLIEGAYNKVLPAEKRTLNFISQKYKLPEELTQRLINEANTTGVTRETMQEASSIIAKNKIDAQNTIEKTAQELSQKGAEIYDDLSKSISTIKSIDDVETLTQHLVKVHNIPEEIASKYAPVLSKLDKVAPIREQFDNIANEMLVYKPKDVINNVSENVADTAIKQADNVKPNRLISKESYQKALKSLGENRLNAGIPVDKMGDALVVAGYHIENGVRSAVELGEKLAQDGYKFTKEQVEKLFNDANLSNEAKKYSNGSDFYEQSGGKIQNMLREKGIRGKEQTTKYWEELVGTKSNKVYAMQHRPNEMGSGYNIDSIGNAPDFYTNPEYYKYSDDGTYDESIRALFKIKDKPEALVTVYRASPKNELNKGDWISLSKKYAQQESKTEGTSVHSFKVKAKDIQFAGDDINEFGYFPKDANKPQFQTITGGGENITTLEQEAKKYKSADEFVKARTKKDGLYHGTIFNFPDEQIGTGEFYNPKTGKGGIF